MVVIGFSYALNVFVTVFMIFLQWLALASLSGSSVRAENTSAGIFSVIVTGLLMAGILSTVFVHMQSPESFEQFLNIALWTDIQVSVGFNLIMFGLNSLVQHITRHS